MSAKLRSSRKGNQQQKQRSKMFFRHLNPVKINPERIRQNNKKFFNDLDCSGIEFPVQEKDFSKIETKNKHLY